VQRKIPKYFTVLVVVGIFIFFGCFTYFGPMRQARQMKIAREFLPIITSAVHSHPEFKDVTAGVGTGSEGCFFIVGMVETKTKLANLKNIIGATKPPVTVSYAIKVAEEYSTVTNN
jgi:hypothetical protein